MKQSLLLFTELGSDTHIFNDLRCNPV